VGTPYAEGCHVLSISPLIAWFFTLILFMLAGRATARLVLSRRASSEMGSAVCAGDEAPGRTLGPAERNGELVHAAMGFGMAVLLAPGLPRPPLAVSVCFFSALAAFAAFGWGQRMQARFRGRTVGSCASSDRGAHLLDSHHAIVGVAMVVMLLRPGMGKPVNAAAMPGMAMGAAPGTAVLLLLAYVWIAALVLGFGMTRVLAGTATSGESGAVLSSPATVYACELAMTVLTGLMLLS